jgi:hypothetical protein
MAQDEYFELEGCPAAEGGEEPANEQEQGGAHGGLAGGACGR